MTIFPKVYTRDFSVALCQVWGSRYEMMLGEKIPAYPGYIYIFEKGLVRAYRNPSSVPMAAGLFKLRNDADSNFLENISAITLVQVAGLKSYNPDEMDITQLAEFLSKLYEFWEGMFVSMYLPEDERFSEKDRNTAFALRRKIDAFEYELFAVIDKSLKKLFPQFGILARYLTRKEIESGKLPDIQVLQARSNQAFFVVGGDLLGQTAFHAPQEQYDFTLEKDDILQNVKELKGNAACKGYAKGEVRIVMRVGDISKVQTGNVLVSSMTIPDFLPAMKKAAAFVTDEGGITCHAAIVAREMRKPCIIGTKHATQVLKDGDMVEVDADNGVVRKI